MPQPIRVTSPTGAFVEAKGYTEARPDLPNAPNRATLDRLPTRTWDTMGFKTSYGYDAKGNVTSVKAHLSEVDDTQVDEARVERNADGTVWKAFSPARPTTDPTIYGYTGHQLTSVDPPGANLGSTTATYDGFGRLGTSTSGRGMTTTFTYDLLDRVKIEAHSDPTIPTITYDHDPAGNEGAKGPPARSRIWRSRRKGPVIASAGRGRGRRSSQRRPRHWDGRTAAAIAGSGAHSWPSEAAG